MTDAPKRPWHDGVFVAMFSAGWGLYFLISTVAPFPGPLYAIFVGTILTVAVVGALGFGINTYRTINRKAIAGLVESREPLNVEYMDGLGAMGLHTHLLIYWEIPPKLVLDRSFENREVFRDFTIWHSRLCLRLIRRKQFFRRGWLLVAYGLGMSTGTLFFYWAIFVQPFWRRSKQTG